jgi:hypothetical protein
MSDDRLPLQGRLTGVVRSGKSLVKDGKLALTSDDLYDRMINLLFIREDPKTNFSIRSDYEVKPCPDGSVKFIRCVQKPAINISYNQVANATAIEVEIEVTNLFIDPAGNNDLFKAEANPVKKILVQAGYRAQFPDWAKSPPGDLKAFYNLNNHGIDRTEELNRSPQTIEVEVLYANLKNNPPDKVTVFHGIIGSLANGLLWNHTMESLQESFSSENLPPELEQPTPIDIVLFVYLRKRYLRPGMDYTIEDVWGKDEKNNKVLEERKLLLAKSRDEDKATMTLVDGVLSNAEAIDYGIEYALSKKLREESAKTQLPQPGRDTLDALDINAALKQVPYIELQERVGGQLDEIRKAFPYLRWYPLPKGGYYFYSEKEKIEDIFKDPYVRERQTSNLVTLPAVYDIAWDGLRTIRCPFVSFLSPMDTVAFQSRYTIGSLVGAFYHPEPGNAHYLVITSKVEFSTVGNTNMMTLTCTDIAKDDAPETEEDGSQKAQEPDSTSTVLDEEAARLESWFTMPWLVVDYVKHPNEVSRVANVLDRMLSGPKDGWSAPPTLLEAYERFKKDNDYLFTAARLKAKSPEDDALGAKLGGVRIPFIYAGETLAVRNPFAPEAWYEEHPNKEPAA